MANVTYQPKDGDPVRTSFHGVNFVANVPVWTQHALLIGQARTNPWFHVAEVSGQAAESKPEQPSGQDLKVDVPRSAISGLGAASVVVDPPKTEDPAKAEELPPHLEKLRTAGLPINADQWRAYALAYINAADDSEDMQEWWNGDEAMRQVIGVGSDDLDYIAPFFNPKIEALRKAEKEGADQG